MYNCEHIREREPKKPHYRELNVRRNLFPILRSCLRLIPLNCISGVLRGTQKQIFRIRSSHEWLLCFVYPLSSSTLCLSLTNLSSPDFLSHFVGGTSKKCKTARKTLAMSHRGLKAEQGTVILLSTHAFQGDLQRLHPSSTGFSPGSQKSPLISARPSAVPWALKISLNESRGDLVMLDSHSNPIR